MNSNNKHIEPQLLTHEPELPQVLKDHKVEPAMRVPEDFFAQFEQKMNAVIDAEVAQAEAQAKVVAMPAQRSALWRWSRIAAVVALVVAVGAAYLVLPSPTLSDELKTGSAWTADVSEAEWSQMEDDLDEALQGQADDLFFASTTDMEMYELFCEL